MRLLWSRAGDTKEPMPYYDYHCHSCGRHVRLFIAYADYDTAQPTCPHCAGTQLKRRVSRVALAKSEEARLDKLLDDRDLAALDDEDPRALGRFMRKLSSETGEDLGEDFNEVVGRLETGESAESIEASMPDLGGLGDDD
jgi:putative FmdB family regulatory protein